MGTANEVEVKSLTEDLERRAGAIIRRVALLCSHDSAIGAELQSKFYDAVCDVESVRISPLPATAGTFLVQDRVMQVSEPPVARLLYTVLDDLQRQRAEKGPVVDVMSVLEDVIGTFVLHELRHRTQGIEAYGMVRELRLADGGLAMAELDALADHDAAFAYAAVKAIDGGLAQFLEAFQEALFLSCAYYFRVFPIESARSDKIARAFGVLLMAARLAAVDLTGFVDESVDLPLDAPLVAHISADKTRLAIFRGEPKRLLAVANDDNNEISDLIADIDGGRFDAALVKSISLLRGVGVIPTIAA